LIRSQITECSRFNVCANFINRNQQFSKNNLTVDRRFPSHRFYIERFQLLRHFCCCLLLLAAAAAAAAYHWTVKAFRSRLHGPRQPLERSSLDETRQICIFASQKNLCWKTIMTFWALIVCAFIALPSGTKSFTSSRFIIGSQADLSKYSCRATTKSIEAIVEHPLQKTSPAELVDRALSYEDVMIATCSLVYPGEESLHYQTQSVHQRKRQKVAANALKRLVKFLVGVSMESERKKVVEDDRFYRLCMCATAPVNEKSSTSGSSSYWETRSDVSSYLDAVYCLGALAPLPQKVTAEAINPLLIQLNQILSDRNSDRNDGLSQFKLKPTEISSLEWAVQRMSRVAATSDNRENENEMTQDKSAAKTLSTVLPSSVSNAISSVKKLQLPFEVLHGVVKGITSIEEMRRMVPFKSETLLTRDGKQG
jgi:hypothetical protein